MLLPKPPALVIAELYPLKRGEKKLRTALSMYSLRLRHRAFRDEATTHGLRVNYVSNIVIVGRADEISTGSDRLGSR